MQKPVYAAWVLTSRSVAKTSMPDTLKEEEPLSDMQCMLWNQAIREGIDITFASLLANSVFMGNALTHVGGVTPYRVVMGRQLACLPPITDKPGLDERIDARVRELALQSMVSATSASRIKRALGTQTTLSGENRFAPGDIVELYRIPPSKDISGWTGPYEVVECRASERIVALKINGQVGALLYLQHFEGAPKEIQSDLKELCWIVLNEPENEYHEFNDESWCYFSDPDNHNEWNYQPPVVSQEFDEYDHTFDFDDDDEPYLEALISPSLTSSFKDAEHSLEPKILHMYLNAEAKKEVIERDTDLLTAQEFIDHRKEVDEATVKEYETWHKYGCFERIPKSKCKVLIDARLVATLVGQKLRLLSFQQ
eukprot:s112_g38.t1